MVHEQYQEEEMALNLRKVEESQEQKRRRSRSNGRR